MIIITSCARHVGSLGTYPIGVVVFKDILYCTESKCNAVAFKDLTGDTIVDVDKLVEKLKGKLKDIGAWNENCKKKEKKYLQEKLREALNNRADQPTKQTRRKRRHVVEPLL